MGSLTHATGTFGAADLRLIRLRPKSAARICRRSGLLPTGLSTQPPPVARGTRLSAGTPGGHRAPGSAYLREAGLRGGGHSASRGGTAETQERPRTLLALHPASRTGTGPGPGTPGLARRGHVRPRGPRLRGGVPDNLPAPHGRSHSERAVSKGSGSSREPHAPPIFFKPRLLARLHQFPPTAPEGF